jgi:hypothetical protein
MFKRLVNQEGLYFLWHFEIIVVGIVGPEYGVLVRNQRHILRHYCT